MKLKFILFIVWLQTFGPVNSQSREESDTLISFENKLRDSMAYVDAKKNNIYLYDESLKIVDTIFKKYAFECESAQVDIIDFTTKWSTVNIRMRSVCLYAGHKEDTILANKYCKQEIKNVKIKTKYLLTYIQFPKIYSEPNEMSKIILDLVTSTPIDETWPHIKDAQIIDIKPEWFKVKFKYKGKNYSGWIPGRYTCPMTFSLCG